MFADLRSFEDAISCLKSQLCGGARLENIILAGSKVMAYRPS